MLHPYRTSFETVSFDKLGENVLCYSSITYHLICGASLASYWRFESPEIFKRERTRNEMKPNANERENGAKYRMEVGEIGRILQSEKTGLLKERLLFSDPKLFSLSTAQQESNPWPANLYLGFSKNERKENGASYAMKPGSHEQESNGGYKHLLSDEKKTWLLCVLFLMKLKWSKPKPNPKRRRRKVKDDRSCWNNNHIEAKNMNSHGCEKALSGTKTADIFFLSYSPLL